MPLKNRANVEVLRLKDLSSDEIGKLAYGLRYQNAEFAEVERQIAEEDELPHEPLQPKRDLILPMSFEKALEELDQADREGRLLIEWKRGWLYFFYCPPIDDFNSDFAGVDMREFLTRVSRPKTRKQVG